MTLSEKILYCRKRCALSQEALAEKIGVSRQAISKWETGEAAPELSKLALLAKTFGVTADWLISEDNPPESAAQGASQKQPAAPAPNANWVWILCPARCKALCAAMAGLPARILPPAARE